MSKALREKAIESYLNREDGAVWKDVMEHARAIYDVRDSINVTAPKFEFNSEEARKLFEEGKIYLQVHPIDICPEEFRDACRAQVKAFIDKKLIEDEGLIAQARAIDWDRISDETVKLAGSNPGAMFDAVRKDLGFDGELTPIAAVLAAILMNVTYRFLEGLGELESEALTHLDDVIGFNKPLLCPTCAQPPTLSFISDNEGKNASPRHLYCSCCGTVWPFERVRCAHCGETKSDKLRYAYAEEDPAHRMHICKTCEGAMPTVFQNQMKGAIDCDVEMLASTVVEALYYEQKEELAAQAEADAKKRMGIKEEAEIKVQ